MESADEKEMRHSRDVGAFYGSLTHMLTDFQRKEKWYVDKCKRTRC